ncbi:MAG TPA: M43 family zinc metalloprotease [Puia sp.]|nr:M43 family zinc metalloprotease [Puia sp.]
MKYALCALCILIDCLPCLSQPVCRSTDYRRHALQVNPALAETAASIEAFTANTLRNRPVIVTGGGSTGTTTTTENNNATVPVITIPVVVHIVYQTSAENIPDAQVQSQIDVLNTDYQKKNRDTAEIPSYYRSLAANCGFRFGLAELDTNGQATTGIVRRQTNVAAFTIDDGIKFSSSGGDDGWDRDRYLNVWVGNLTGGILGYSSVIGGPKATDGVVVLYTAFGTNGTATVPFNLGRTTVHEVGHWLNMIHTWGDDSCGNDQVADTPPQEGPDYGDPGGIVISCGNDPYGNLYQDYMDFTNDIGMHLFTYGQRARMRTLFVEGGFRYPLLSSNVPVALADSTWGGDQPAISITTFPNPAVSGVTVNLADPSSVGGLLEVYDQVGRQVLTMRVTSMQLQLDVSSWSAGMYFIRVSEGGKAVSAKLMKI